MDPPESTPESVIFPAEALMYALFASNAIGPLQLALLPLVLTKAPAELIPEPSRFNVSPETVCPFRSSTPPAETVVVPVVLPNAVALPSFRVELAETVVAPP